MAHSEPQNVVEIGSKVAGWTVRRVIGKGSSGTVYEVEKRNQRAALKVIVPDTANETALPRFRREVKLLQGVRHANVCRLLSWGEGEFFWLILEYLPRSVEWFLSENERANVPQAVGVLRMVLSGLQAIHDQGIVHRDVKPDNLLLGKGSVVKLADFGLARRDSSSTSLTRTGVVLGTPFYMSPEQCRGRDLDGRSDLYACGVLLYHLLTGRPPYSGKSSLEVLQLHMGGDVPDLRAVLPNAPPQLARAVGRLMAKNPEDRPKSATDAKRLFDGLPSARLPLPPRGRSSRSGAQPALVAEAVAEAVPVADSTESARAVREAAQSKRRARAKAQGPARPLPPPPGTSRLLNWTVGIAALIGLSYCADWVAQAAFETDVLGEATRMLRANAPSVEVRDWGLAALTWIDRGREVLNQWLMVWVGVLAFFMIDRFLARVRRFGILGRLKQLWRARALRLRGETHAAAKAYELLGMRRYGAELLLAGGMPRPAAEMFEDAGMYQRQGDALIAAGRKDEAFAAYKRAGNDEAMSDVARLGDTSQQSAERLQASGHIEEAVHAHRRAGRRYQAAELLEQEGRYEEAASELEGAYAASTDCRDYWHFLGKKGPLEQAKPKLAKRIGELYARVGVLQSAASYFEKAGDLEQATGLFERSGDQRGLARCLLSGIPAKGDLSAEHKERVERAARALSLVSDPTAVDLFRRVGNFKEAAGLSRELGELAQAAKLFTLAKMSKEAANCARAAGELEQAATLYEDAGDYETASQLYEEIGQLNDAAAAARKAKDPEREAKLYLKAGEPLRAAKAQIELGRGEAALQTLKQVPRTDPFWSDACLLAAKVHAKAGRHNEAIPLFEKGVGSEIFFPEEVPTLLSYVQSLEAEGLIERGLDALSMLDGKAFAPADLAQRKDHLKAVARGGRSPAASSSGVHGSLSAGSVARSSRVQAKDLVGSVLAGYSLLRLAGEGSFAWVYEAQRSEAPRVAAIKVLKPMLLSASAPQRFLREGRSLAMLKNPHLIQVYEMGELDGLCYLVLEFVKGPTLKKVISDDAPLPIPLACRYGAGILSALGTAHEHGVIHRDLKPANVLIDRRDSRAKVLDFGLALLFEEGEEDADAGKPGAYLGTPRYASPEQARGQEVGEAADQYAAALLLYEMIGGALPFSSRNSLGYLNLHATEPPRPLRELRKDVPKSLEIAILRALSKKPEDRFPTVKEFEKIVAMFIGRRARPRSGARRT